MNSTPKQTPEKRPGQTRPCPFPGSTGSRAALARYLPDQTRAFRGKDCPRTVLERASETTAKYGKSRDSPGTVQGLSLTRFRTV